MKFYKDLEKRKENIREYIRKNPKATFKEIKENIHTKINKVYLKGIDEAYEDAGVSKPRTLKFKTKEEKRKIIIDYIGKNPKAGGQIIRRDTKIDFLTLFKNTEEMFESAGVPYPRKEFRRLILRDSDVRRKNVIKLLKENPLLGVEDLGRLSSTSLYHYISSIKELYENAGIEYRGKGFKRRIKKQNEAITYIKQNPFATQREINNVCKTHVQSIFNNGIFEAYKLAEVSFPFERLKIHGGAIKYIREESRIFEERIAKKLSGYGKVNRLVKTKRGIADVIFERNGKKVVIEVKNYKVHEISISQVKQLNKYLEDVNANLGFLICRIKPKRDSFLMDSNKIFILSESELIRIPEIMDL